MHYSITKKVKVEESINKLGSKDFFQRLSKASH